MFHPFEIAFCGLSGSGKTTLATEVIRHFRLKGDEPAYYKHGCHHFDIDREGKDSFLARQAGAALVMISDPGKEAIIAEAPGTLSNASTLLSCDMLMIEGLKELKIPKLLLVDAGRAILPLMENGTVSQVLGLVHDGNSDGLDNYGLPLFCRDDVPGIAAFIERCLADRAAEVPLNGLVLAGGLSSRMGTDKALLSYHPENQLVTTAALLSCTCGEVFISCRQEQAATYCTFGYPVITDSYLDMGPMGGLLSAQRHAPDAAWLVAACDLPFICADTINALLSNRDPFRYATGFMSPESGRPEPLLTIYEPKSRQALLRQHSLGNDSLSSFLQLSRAVLIKPVNPGSITNVNDKDQMDAAKKAIHSSRCSPRNPE
ncbi:MAG: bifunctional molybdenum cofactor guanylyltransferase MobA/molybdopterin-guanine dinucleotide biosynthesis adaptor protein MobB [Chlorobiaceae bacterium]|nr:bifunctional molybdenum cofactor guanylyltransferase MobA/molybdopterin-guanine dinucleotide biosynthesis adaptor protein MobB [Chlorobiaceae bacterium]